MKRISRISILVFSIAILALHVTTTSFAQTLRPSVDFDLTPLTSGTDISDGSNSPTPSITDSPPSGDWTVSVGGGSGTQYKAYGYRLKLPSEFQAGQCADGIVAKVAGIRKTIEVKSAAPNDGQFGALASAQDILVGSSNIDQTGGTFDYINTAPEGTLVGTSTIGYYFTNPISYADFNSESNLFYGFVAVTAPPSGGFSTVVGPANFSAIVSCGDEVLQGANNGGSGGGSSEDESANSPKTGAGEVLLGTFLVALLASSFLVYKAIQKHRKTSQLSEK